MRHRARSIPWAGQCFRFERLRIAESGPDSIWAVSRSGEFIGTLRCSGEITTAEFDIGCRQWLADLLASGGDSGGDGGLGP
jgi:hypothetical protein